MMSPFRLLVISFMFVVCLLWCLACNALRPAAPPVVPKISYFSIGWSYKADFEFDQQLVAEFTKETGIEVKLFPPTESATDLLPTYLKILESKATTPDVLGMDIMWTNFLADHLVDLTTSCGAEAKQHWPVIVQSASVAGQLLAMPLYASNGVLYVRTDLLKKYGYKQPPQTWDELEQMALKIQTGERAQGNKDFWGYLWQGAEYEGLTCNALEWQASAGGGQFIENNQRINLANAPTIKAIERAARWVGRISPPSVLAFREEDTRNIWHAGNAAFMRNWSYRKSLRDPQNSVVKEISAISLLPSGGARAASTLGGALLGVSKYSTQPQAAIAFVKFMTSRKTQRRRALQGAIPPTIMELYDDPELVTAQPHFPLLKKSLTDVVVLRPVGATGKKYNDVSQAYYSALHSILTRPETATTALSELETRLSQITGLPTTRSGPAIPR